MLIQQRLILLVAERWIVVCLVASVIAISTLERIKPITQSAIYNDPSAGIGPLDRHITIAIAIPPLFARDACPRRRLIARFIGVAPIAITIIAFSDVVAVNISL